MLPPSSRARLRALPALVLALVALPACDSGGPEEPESDDVVAFGVNYTRLFAEPSAAEVAAVRAEWAGRNPSSSNDEIIGSAATGAGTAHLVRHTVTAAGSEPVVHYGVVHVPDGAEGELPVVVVHHGGDGGFSVGGQGANGTVAGFAAAFPEVTANAVLAFPVYRSEPVRTDGFPGLGPTVTAGGSPSPWDYDVDDSIAFLDAALALFDDETDADRVGAVGFSRGGNTAALHAVRDDRVDALVDYYGPTDFYNEVVEILTTGLLTGNSTALLLPGGPFLLATVLNPLRNADGTANPNADYAAARLEVVRRSASLFEDSLPATQVHHHVRDGVVPIQFSQAFAARAEGGGGGPFEFFAYDNAPPSGVTPHNAEAMPESLTRTEAFLAAELAFDSVAGPLVVR